MSLIDDMSTEELRQYDDRGKTSGKRKSAPDKKPEKEAKKPKNVGELAFTEDVMGSFNKAITTLRPDYEPYLNDEGKRCVVKEKDGEEAEYVDTAAMKLQYKKKSIDPAIVEVFKNLSVPEMQDAIANLDAAYTKTLEMKQLKTDIRNNVLNASSVISQITTSVPTTEKECGLHLLLNSGFQYEATKKSQRLPLTVVHDTWEKLHSTLVGEKTAPNLCMEVENVIKTGKFKNTSYAKLMGMLNDVITIKKSMEIASRDCHMAQPSPDAEVVKPYIESKKKAPDGEEAAATADDDAEDDEEEEE